MLGPVNRPKICDIVAERLTAHISHRRLMDAGGLWPLLGFSDLLAAFFDILRAGQLPATCEQWQHCVRSCRERREGEPCA
jgi:hypothetical protein